MSGEWWAGLAPVMRKITCGETEHRLRWRAGELHAVDHPDADRELLLVALGADRLACLEMLSSWRAHCDDLDVLVLARRGPSDRLATGGNRRYATRVLGVPTVGRVGWTGYSPHGPSGRQPYVSGPARDLVFESILSHPSLGDRLAATVIASWCERIESGADLTGVRPRLHSALYGRVRLALHDWLGDRFVRCEVRLIDPGERPGLTRSGDTVTAALPFAWLRDVWVPGFAAVAGRFALAATLDAGGFWRVLTVGPDFGAPEELTVTAHKRRR